MRLSSFADYAVVLMAASARHCGGIARLNATLGLTSIVVTHHVHETLPIADQAVVIANGGLVFSGTPSELEGSADPLVKQFLRGEPDGPIAFGTFASPIRARSNAIISARSISANRAETCSRSRPTIRASLPTSLWPRSARRS